MTGTTQIDYDKINAICKNRRIDADRLLELVKQAEGKFKSLRDQKQWEGQAATKFFHEMEQTVLPALYRLEQALRLTADVAQQIGDTLHRADEETQSFFTNLGQ
jgi:WXG100 family type VII secretion target